MWLLSNTMPFKTESCASGSPVQQIAAPCLSPLQPWRNSPSCSPGPSLGHLRALQLTLRGCGCSCSTALGAAGPFVFLHSDNFKGNPPVLVPYDELIREGSGRPIVVIQIWILWSDNGVWPKGSMLMVWEATWGVPAFSCLMDILLIHTCLICFLFVFIWWSGLSWTCKII